MNHDSYPDGAIREILKSVKTIALVGASNNPARPSWIVTKYLLERGYDVIPINPGWGGREILGRPVYARLSEVPRPVDMVEIFRNSEAAGPITDEALGLDPLPKVIWMQLSVRNDAAAARAEAHGVQVVMNRCPKIEYGRLSGEIGWQGVNSRILSARKPVLAGKGFQKLTINRPGTLIIPSPGGRGKGCRVQPSPPCGVLLEVCRGAWDARDRTLAAVAGGVPCHAGAGARRVHAVSRLRSGRDRPDLDQSKRCALEHQPERLQPERGPLGGLDAERHEPERDAVHLRAAGDGAVAAARRAEREPQPRAARRGRAASAGPEPGSKDKRRPKRAAGASPARPPAPRTTRRRPRTRPCAAPTNGRARSWAASAAAAKAPLPASPVKRERPSRRKPTG